jgi:hypothetical protein
LYIGGNAELFITASVVIDGKYILSVVIDTVAQ